MSGWTRRGSRALVLAALSAVAVRGSTATASPPPPAPPPPATTTAPGSAGPLNVPPGSAGAPGSSPDGVWMPAPAPGSAPPLSPTPGGQSPAPKPPAIGAQHPQRATHRARRRGHRSHHPPAHGPGASPPGPALPPSPGPNPLSGVLPAPDGSLPSLAGQAISSLYIRDLRVPAFLLPIYQAAASTYRIPWQVLAAINEVETNYGRDLGVSSAGAEGWMQFLPSEWRRYGVDATGAGVRDPYNPADAIFAAARYLRAAGGDHDLRAAVFAYNHSSAYVQSVLLRAQLLTSLPETLVDSLSGLANGHFPLAARGHPRYAQRLSSGADRSSAGTATAAAPGGPALPGRARPAPAAPAGPSGTPPGATAPPPVGAGGPTAPGTHHGVAIYARAQTAVVAVQDGRVVRIGHSSRLGRYLQLRDVYGNTYTYAHLGTIAATYVFPRAPRLHGVRNAPGAPSPGAPPTAAASAGQQSLGAAGQAPPATVGSTSSSGSGVDSSAPPSPAAQGPSGVPSSLPLEPAWSGLPDSLGALRGASPDQASSLMPYTVAAATPTAAPTEPAPESGPARGLQPLLPSASPLLPIPRFSVPGGGGTSPVVPATPATTLQDLNLGAARAAGSLPPPPAPAPGGRPAVARIAQVSGAWRRPARASAVGDVPRGASLAPSDTQSGAPAAPRRAFGLQRSELAVRALRRGAPVLAGTVLGDLGPTTANGHRPHLLFALRPAAPATTDIDARPFLDIWSELESVTLNRRPSHRPLVGPDARQATIGRILLMGRTELQRLVLDDPAVHVYSCGRADIAAGRIDRRVLATLEYLAASGLAPTVSALQCGHSELTTSGNVSEHSTGDAVDIAAINGVPIVGHQGPGSITDTTIRRLLALSGDSRPHQIISLMSFPGADNTLALPDHYDHIHIGYRPTAPARAPAGSPPVSAPTLVLDDQRWRELAVRLMATSQPTVAAAPSRAALPDVPAAPTPGGQ